MINGDLELEPLAGCAINVHIQQGFVVIYITLSDILAILGGGGLLRHNEMPGAPFQNISFIQPYVLSLEGKNGLEMQGLGVTTKPEHVGLGPIC